eukprot:TRINITY_DN5162_c0_g1_i2.p1 TRINITY_DN5162_c0_g1~~TRINITY_DN5162_c0_g1_i2.p1  ORF type:complete len:563 (+),score=166.84 TRINITY_DN5162_c0_g1_i2:27-1691(+)
MEETKAASDSEDEGASGIDFASLAQAQQLAGELSAGTAQVELPEKKKKRAGAKESQKRRKRQKRENDFQCVKQAGIALPSLKEVLRDPAKWAPKSIPSLKEALREAAASRAAKAEAPQVGSADVSKERVLPEVAGTGLEVCSRESDASASGCKAEVAETGSSQSQAVREEPTLTASAPASSSSRAGEASISLASTQLPSAQVVVERQPASYEDAEDDCVATGAPPAAKEVQPSAADVFQEERVTVALTRIAKDSARRVKVAKAVNARSVFITNLPFKATEEELRQWLAPGGTIKGLRLNRDKATTKSLGYGHVQFESAEAAEKVVAQCDKVELHGRVLRTALVTAGEKFQFELPEEIKEDIRALVKEAYEGMNISTIKDAWQKRHPGQKLDTSKWGFKNFSSAVKTIEGIQLEHHLEKTLTYLAFFPGSEKHRAFLEDKSKRPAPESNAEDKTSKRAAAEADLPEARKKAKLDDTAAPAAEAPNVAKLDGSAAPAPDAAAEADQPEAQEKAKLEDSAAPSNIACCNSAPLPSAASEVNERLEECKMSAGTIMAA